MGIPDETLDIETPENVAFGYQVAGIGSRFLATLLDTLLLILLQVMVFVVLVLILNGFDLLGENLSAWVMALMGIVGFVFFWGYYIFFEMLWNGQSPGKRWVGLRVIRTDGTPITLSESFIRNLTRLVDFLPAAYGLGILSMFLDKQSRRLGDLAAGTLVVHDRAPVSIQSLAARRTANLSLQGHQLASLEGFPLERLTNNDLALIEDFLLRREQLTHREALASQILNTLHARLGLPAPTLNRSEAEVMLLTILYTVRQREPLEYRSTHDSSKSTRPE